MENSKAGRMPATHMSMRITDYDVAVHRAVIDERMRIAKELYDKAREFERREFGAVERSGDNFDSVALMYYHMKNATQLYADSLVYSVFPWQEWFDMGPIHGGK